eukprot:scaffold5121_cov42-Prasinocladus_malaysianus.AAC.2
MSTIRLPEMWCFTIVCTGAPFEGDGVLSVDVPIELDQRDTVGIHRFYVPDTAMRTRLFGRLWGPDKLAGTPSGTYGRAQKNQTDPRG